MIHTLFAFPCLWLFGFSLIQITTFAEASSSGSSSALVLDKYGNAVQLRHAQDAAQQQGSLVMVFDRSRESGESGNDAGASTNEFWVISLAEDDEYEEEDDGGDGATKSARRSRVGHLRPQQQQPHYFSQGLGGSPTTLSLGKRYTGCFHFLHPLIDSFSHSFHQQPKEGGQPPPGLAMVCVGVQADAKWLLGRVQEYATLVWEQTDTQHLSVQALLLALSAVVRQCALPFYRSYDSKLQSHGPALEELLKEDNDDDDDEQESRQERLWARPLGLCTLVLDGSASKQPGGETTGSGRLPEKPRMYRVDPSGVVQPIFSNFACLGKHSMEVQTWWQRLQQQQNNNGNGDEAHGDLLLLKNDQALFGRLRQCLARTLGDEKLPRCLRVEVWSGTGRQIQRRIVPLNEVAGGLTEVDEC